MARILMPILNNPAPEIRLAPESDAVMAIIPRIKSFPPTRANAIPKEKIAKSPATITKTPAKARAIIVSAKAPPIGAAQMERNVRKIIFQIGVSGSFLFSVIRLSFHKLLLSEYRVPVSRLLRLLARHLQNIL